MALRNGIDTVGVISFGVYTETYGASAQANINNIYASKGLLENAPNVTINIAAIAMYYLTKIWRRR